MPVCIAKTCSQPFTANAKSRSVLAWSTLAAKVDGDGDGDGVHLFGCHIGGSRALIARNLQSDRLRPRLLIDHTQGTQHSTLDHLITRSLASLRGSKPRRTNAGALIALNWYLVRESVTSLRPLQL